MAGDLKELNVIIKADVGGSIEVLRDRLGAIGTDEVKVNVLAAAASENAIWEWQRARSRARRMLSSPDSFDSERSDSSGGGRRVISQTP